MIEAFTEKRGLLFRVDYFRYLSKGVTIFLERGFNVKSLSDSFTFFTSWDKNVYNFFIYINLSYTNVSFR